MAVRLITSFDGAGAYAIIRREADGFAWNGAAFEAWVDGNIGNYAIALEDLGGGLWGADLPAGLAGVSGLRAYFYEQAGASPDITDLRFGSMEIVAEGAAAGDGGGGEASPGLGQHENLYANLEELKAELQISGADSDGMLLEFLESSSREADDYCKRFFYSQTKTEYFDCHKSGCLELFYYDLLSITTLKTGETPDLWAASDYVLYPYNKFPLWKITAHPDGALRFPVGPKGVEIAGIWGYGDEKRAAPWDAAPITATAADDVTTTVAASDGTAVRTGQTILLEAEQMCIQAINGNSLTVRRAVNGTTPAAHSMAPVFRAAYPRAVRDWAIWSAKEKYDSRLHAGYTSERQGDYSYTIIGREAYEDQRERVLGPYVRKVTG